MTVTKVWIEECCTVCPNCEAEDNDLAEIEAEHDYDAGLHIP